MWKQISRQSERQLGVFLSQWLITTKQEFPLDNKMSEFRNKVVHRGYIPLQEETEEYASWINDRLFDIVDILRGWKDGALTDIRNFYITNAHSSAASKHNISKSIPIVSINPPSLTNLHVGNDYFKRASFEEVCAMARQTAKHRGIETILF